MLAIASVAPPRAFSTAPSNQAFHPVQPVGGDAERPDVERPAVPDVGSLVIHGDALTRQTQVGTHRGDVGAARPPPKEGPLAA